MKKSQKHDANLQKNSTLYFQIGLIVCLLVAFGLLEMKFETTIPIDYSTRIPDDDTYVDIPIIKPEIVVTEKPIERKQVKYPEKFEEVPNDTPEKFFKEAIVKTTIDVPVFDPDVLPKLEKKPEEPENVPFVSIQNAPIYPGCENAKDNDTRKKCMSEKISKLIQRKFDGTEIASNYGLTGKQKIDVQFTIDKNGHVTNIKTRAPHAKLEKEAVRVINFIPKMTPGKQRDKNVGVIYNLPIVFQVK
ncbi:energy transducer TonB [uncultured Algibacter sp.]|uniref:energy transducer TonB n=1 Tax=uncultured Algibacter sp. TaxID=298659 RepID=UPI0026057302|nr:energy transducer TonB [uncultured Algibacter sp.]